MPAPMCEVCRVRRARQFDRCPKCDDTAWNTARQIFAAETPEQRPDVNAVFDLYEWCLERFREHYNGDPTALAEVKKRLPQFGGVN